MVKLTVIEPVMPEGNSVFCNVPPAAPDAGRETAPVALSEEFGNVRVTPITPDEVTLPVTVPFCATVVLIELPEIAPEELIVRARVPDWLVVASLHVPNQVPA